MTAPTSRRPAAAERMAPAHRATGNSRRSGALQGRGEFDVISEELKDYAAAENLTLLAYSPLLGGAYGRASSVAQLEEMLAATGLKLDDAQLARLAGASAQR
ncbi:MAG TPA: hypothetical protein VMI73_07525 [Trebonia sp.]|nr:hypothetical protein [Trebonia sp.]